MSPSDALSKIPGWDANNAEWRELSGGLSNRSYRVEQGNDTFVLRLNAAHTNAFGLDRVSEIKILKQAAAAGLAPELIYADTESGILLSRYVPGDAWEASDLDDDEKLEALARLLRRVHELPLSGVVFDSSRVAKHYVENLGQHHRFHTFAIRCQEIIANIPVGDTIRCCHNDIVAGNIIGNSSLKLLDWEYACDNNPMFDLASLIGYHNLKDDRQSIFLDAYVGGKDSGMKERLNAEIRRYDAIQWLWLANRHMITTTSAQAARLEQLEQRIR